MTGVYIDSCYGAVNRVPRTTYRDYSAYAYRKYSNNGASYADNGYGSYNYNSYPSNYYSWDSIYTMPYDTLGYSGGYNNYSNYGSYYQHGYSNVMSNNGSVWRDAGYYSNGYNSPDGGMNFDYYNSVYRKYYVNNDSVNNGNSANNSNGNLQNAANDPIDDASQGEPYISDSDIVLSDEDAAIIRAQLGDIVDEEALRMRQEEAGSFGGAVATGAVAATVGIPGVQKGLFSHVKDINVVKPVTEMFWGANGAGATQMGKNLWKNNTDLMLKLEGNMNTLYSQYSKIAAKNPGSAVVSEELSKITKIAEEAITSGNPESLNRAIQASDKAISAGLGDTAIGRLFRRGNIANATLKREAVESVMSGYTASTATRAAEEAGARAATTGAVERTAAEAAEKGAIRGTIGRSFFRGAGAMAILSVGIDAIPKLVRGEEVNWKETGTRAVLSSVAFCAAETAATRAVAWGVGKLSGRAIGAAVGSIWPGVGTAIGFVVGCVADWAINKFVMPKLFPPDTSEQKNEISQMSKAELLALCVAKDYQGQNIGATGQKFLNDNRTATDILRQSIK